MYHRKWFEINDIIINNSVYTVFSMVTLHSLF